MSKEKRFFDPTTSNCASFCGHVRMGNVTHKLFQTDRYAIDIDIVHCSACDSITFIRPTNLRAIATK